VTAGPSWPPTASSSCGRRRSNHTSPALRLLNRSCRATKAPSPFGGSPIRDLKISFKQSCQPQMMRYLKSARLSDSRFKLMYGSVVPLGLAGSRCVRWVVMIKLQNHITCRCAEGCEVKLFIYPCSNIGWPGLGTPANPDPRRGRCPRIPGARYTSAPARAGARCSARRSSAGAGASGR
jgi:hypothetical protein